MRNRANDTILHWHNVPRRLRAVGMECMVCICVFFVSLFCYSQPRLHIHTGRRAAKRVALVSRREFERAMQAPRRSMAANRKHFRSFEFTVLINRRYVFSSSLFLDATRSQRLSFATCLSAQRQCRRQCLCSLIRQQRNVSWGLFFVSVSILTFLLACRAAASTTTREPTLSSPTNVYAIAIIFIFVDSRTVFE